MIMFFMAKMREDPSKVYERLKRHREKTQTVKLEITSLEPETKEAFRQLAGLDAITNANKLKTIIESWQQRSLPTSVILAYSFLGWGQQEERQQLIQQIRDEIERLGGQVTQHKEIESCGNLTCRGFTRIQALELANTLNNQFVKIKFAVVFPAESEDLDKASQILKFMRVGLYLRVENNNKFVRRRSKTKENIENHILSRYALKKPKNARCEYELTIPYRTQKELDDILYDLESEMGQEADMRNGFVECDFVCLDDPDRHIPSWESLR